MTEPQRDPAPAGGVPTPHDSGGGPSAGWLRGLAVVVAAVVVGVVFLPSATRAPLRAATAASSSSSTTTPPGTSPTSTSTTTTTLPTVVPGATAIHVLVANGTTITGLAAGIGTYLHSRGYTVIGAVNATAKVAATRVFAATGEQGAAGTVVSVLGLPASDIQPPESVAPVASATGATVVVVAGPDLGRLAPSSTGGSSAT
ncbi:MAG TPA: LytR C-terminal domain-containing protein [Acidimicrobiales bacterium]|nr:LytR C-terminal domain-containing protein [Acidimicrobiales bacterium]